MENGRIKADMPPDQLISSTLLKETGLREPLYVSALKFAGVQVREDMAPARIDTLSLNDTQKTAVREWSGHPQDIPWNGVGKGNSPSMLAVEHLCFSYGTDYALNDVSFHIESGEMTAILGANGAGKSTLAKLLCGFEKPNAGKIALNGRDMAKDSIAERAKHIGYVMQNPNQMICESMIYDEAAFGPRNRGISEPEVKDRVEHALDICGLHPFQAWPVSALSFGQKKRLTVAAALTLSPEILILDEPTAGQDYKHYSDILEFLKGLNEQGVTVLMITHDMHLCLEYAKRALVLSEGRLIADTTPAHALTDGDLTARASLKQTSLYDLARICGVPDAAGFVQHYIDWERGGLWQRQ
jgi:energy-coupling factor transport system ATP-binding protein